MCVSHAKCVRVGKSVSKHSGHKLYISCHFLIFMWYDAPQAARIGDTVIP